MSDEQLEQLKALVLAKTDGLCLRQTNQGPLWRDHLDPSYPSPDAARAKAPYDRCPCWNCRAARALGVEP